MPGDHPRCPECQVTMSYLASGEDNTKHYTCPCCNAHTKHGHGRVETIKRGSPMPIVVPRRRSSGVVAALVGVLD